MAGDAVNCTGSRGAREAGIMVLSPGPGRAHPRCQAGWIDAFSVVILIRVHGPIELDSSERERRPAWERRGSGGTGIRARSVALPGRWGSASWAWRWSTTR